MFGRALYIYTVVVYYFIFFLYNLFIYSFVHLPPFLPSSFSSFLLFFLPPFLVFLLFLSSFLLFLSFDLSSFF